MSAHRPNRHEFDGRPYREVSFVEFLAGYEWVPAALYAVILIVLYVLDGYMNFRDWLTGGLLG